MDKYYKWKVLLILVLVSFSLWSAYPPKEKINLGLDLQGGMQLLLQVELDKVPEEAREDATERVVEIIRNRIDEFGVSEPVISQQGNNQVVVQLPGVTDRKRAKEVIGRTAHLEFRMASDNEDLISKAEGGEVLPDFELKEMKQSVGLGTQSILLNKEAVLTGDRLTNASVGFDQYGQAIVQLQFDKEGGKIFDSVTFQNIGKQLAIVLDGVVHSAPVIRDRIPNGQAQISGSFTPAEAGDLALVLRAGALPAPVTVIEERTVGPTLGRDSIQKGLKAGIIGALLVFVFMPIYYMRSGLIGALGLVIYGILLVGGLTAVKATLTLPGIAGFILSIGMAVDANVLINERIREELKTGKGTRAAISAGYHRAWSAIMDSNVTTLVTSMILFMFGTGPVQGFAVTLSIGILASMFSSIFVTRVIFDFVTKRFPSMKLKMNQLFTETKIPFMKGRFFAYGFSVLTLAVGIFSFVMRGDGNYGVEFTGGTTVQLAFAQPIEMSAMRQELDRQGIPNATLQQYGDTAENQYLIKTQKVDTNKIEDVAAAVGGENRYEVLKVDEIGPTVSVELSKKALQALLFASLGILLYLAYRFEWKFAVAAVIAIFHDTLFTFGIYALSGREVNVSVVAAILTVMGFSVNDTIVTFDRIRDNRKSMRRVPFNQVVEASINQMLSRTVLTTVTSLLAVVALFVFGGSAINDFAFILLIGFIVGTYSSVFVATALVVDWKARR